MHLIYCHLLPHLMQQLSYLARLAFLYRLRLSIVDVPAQPIQLFKDSLAQVRRPFLPEEFNIVLPVLCLF